MTDAGLKLALIRLLWDSVVDEADCTCCPGDPCPQCEGMQALGFERWVDADTAEAQLACLEFRIKQEIPT